MSESSPKEYDVFQKYRKPKFVVIESKIKYLSKFVTDERLKLLNEKIDLRTRYMSVCLENVYQSQNAGAVLRSCDAFGIQDVHIIDNIYDFRINPDVTLGTEKWLDIHKYSVAVEDVIRDFKDKGYRITATVPDKKAKPLHDFDAESGKFMLMFGTELTGLSDDVINSADEFLYIPMHGFVESLNISVSAGVCAYNLGARLRSSGVDWRLTPVERKEIMFRWLKSSVRSSESIMKRFVEPDE